MYNNHFSTNNIYSYSNTKNNNNFHLFTVKNVTTKNFLINAFLIIKEMGDEEYIEPVDNQKYCISSVASNSLIAHQKGSCSLNNIVHFNQNTDLRLLEQAQILKRTQSIKNEAQYDRGIQLKKKNSYNSLLLEEKSQKYQPNKQEMLMEEDSCEKENIFQKDQFNRQGSQLSHNNLALGCNEKKTISRSLSTNIPQILDDQKSQGNSYQYSHDQYLDEIISHLKATEGNCCTHGGYVGTTQNEVNERMRSILLDWLVDVHHKFKLRIETLYITVNLTDRYLEKVQITSSKLQLLSISALFIAAKYEEVYLVPHISDLVYICDNAYTQQELLEMEGDILRVLNFKILSVSSNRFLELFVLFDNQIEEKNKILAQYLLEIALLEYKLLNVKTSLIAAAVLYLVNKIRKRYCPWKKELQEASGYSESDIRPTAKQICHILQTVDERKYYSSLKKKYSSLQYLEVAKIKIEQQRKEPLHQQQLLQKERSLSNKVINPPSSRTNYTNKPNLEENNFVSQPIIKAQQKEKQQGPHPAKNQKEELSHQNEIMEQESCESIFSNLQKQQLQLREGNLSIKVSTSRASYIIQQRIQQIIEKPNNLIQMLIFKRLFEDNEQQPINMKISVEQIVQEIYHLNRHIYSIQQLYELSNQQLILIAESILNCQNSQQQQIYAFSNQFADILIENVVQEQLILLQNEQSNAQSPSS